MCWHKCSIGHSLKSMNVFRFNGNLLHLTFIILEPLTAPMMKNSIVCVRGESNSILLLFVFYTIKLFSNYSSLRNAVINKRPKRFQYAFVNIDGIQKIEIFSRNYTVLCNFLFGPTNLLCVCNIFNFFCAQIFLQVEKEPDDNVLSSKKAMKILDQIHSLLNGVLI